MAVVNAHVIECDTDPTEAPDDVAQHWVNYITKCMWLSVGTDTVNDWMKIDFVADFTVEVPDATPVNLHLLPISGFCSLDYQICIFNDSEDKYRQILFHAGKKSSTVIDPGSAYSILGESLDVDLNFKKVATDGVLEAINNEAFAVTIRYKVNVL